MYHIRSTRPIKKLEALEVSLLAHKANLKKIFLKMKDFEIFQKKVNLPSMQRLGCLYYSLQIFSGCKTKILRSSFTTHIHATGPIKKLKELEVSLLAHIPNLLKICLKMKDFEIFQKKVNFPSMQRVGSSCYSLQNFFWV